MIVVLKHGVEAAKREQLIAWLEGQGLTIHICLLYTSPSPRA